MEKATERFTSERLSQLAEIETRLENIVRRAECYIRYAKCVRELEAQANPETDDLKAMLYKWLLDEMPAVISREIFSQNQAGLKLTLETIEPANLRLGNVVITISSRVWLLIDRLLFQGAKRDTEDSIIDLIWGEEGLPSSNAIRQLCKKTNQSLQSIGAKQRIRRRDGWIMLIDEDFNEDKQENEKIERVGHKSDTVWERAHDISGG